MLKKYTSADFKLLQKWVSDEDILFQFSGPDWSFPLQEDVINEHIAKFPHRQFYIGYKENGEAYAFGQIIGNEANAPRLGRLLVGEPSERGKGLGTIFVRELIEECKRTFPSEEIYLFVDEHNLPAIRCYEKLGFKFNDGIKFTMPRRETDINILRMSLQTKDVI